MWEVLVGEGGETLKNEIEDEPYFVARCGGNDGKEGSITSRTGGGWFAKLLMESNEAKGDVCLEGCEGARGREVNVGGADLGVFKSCLEENPGGAIGEFGGDSRGVEGGAD
uniref:Uncharacterized protein n=1 Tax=Tanacetum cinerariifolium TaxID=118510 RepID=A0A699HX32_TANCI|nr:hypothetical protein [Tanacetum cinerariifolium]